MPELEQIRKQAIELEREISQLKKVLLEGDAKVGFHSLAERIAISERELRDIHKLLGTVSSEILEVKRTILDKERLNKQFLMGLFAGLGLLGLGGGLSVARIVTLLSQLAGGQ